MELRVVYERLIHASHLRRLREEEVRHPLEHPFPLASLLPRSTTLLSESSVDSETEMELMILTFWVQRI